MTLRREVYFKSKPTSLPKDDEFFPRLNDDEKAHLLQDEYNIIISSEPAPEVPVSKSSK